MPGCFFMLLVNSGAIRADCEGAAFALSPGGLLLVPPGLRLLLRLAPGAGYDSFSFGRSLVNLNVLESSVDLAIETLSANSPRLARLSIPDFQEAHNLFCRMEKENAERRPEYEAMIRLKLLEIILIFSRNLERNSTQPNDAPLHFNARNLKLYLEEHYSGQLTLDDLARRFGLNPAYLSRAFSRESGYTIVEYINRIRIQKSCILLKRSQASILEIAMAVGYNNLSHFNRYFRRIMETNPRDYRIASRR